VKGNMNLNTSSLRWTLLCYLLQ